MELSAFTVILTDRCNFNCFYCYQNKGKRQLDIAALAKSLRFFYPFFKKECYINFYGGEPLLAFERIKQSVTYLEGLKGEKKKKIHYSLSTNGSLLDDHILEFLDEHRFFLLLSFDGLAQDIARKKGSFDFIVSIIPKILKKRNIRLETNSVFTQETIGYLTKSIELIAQMGVQNINIGFSSRPRWTASSLVGLRGEMALARKYFLSAYKRKTEIPWTDLTKEYKKTIYYCCAGRDQMALAADGTLWGCFLFPHYFNGRKRDEDYEKYCFGDVGSFINNHENIYQRILANYSFLRMDNFFINDAPCVMCDEVEGCWICPVSAAFSSRTLGRISGQTCRMAKMLRTEKKVFLKEFEEKKTKPISKI